MSNDYLSVLATMHNESVQAGNEIATKVAAQTVDQGKVISQVRDETPTEDEKILSFRQWYETAIAEVEKRVEAINSHIAQSVLNVERMTPEAIDTAKEEFDKYAVTRKAALAAMATQPEFTPEWAAANLTTHLTFKGSKSTGIAGDGPARPRFDRIDLDDKPISKSVKNAKGEMVEKSTLSILAAHVTELHKSEKDFEPISAKELFEALEATSADWKSANDVTFNMRGGHKVTVYPAKSAK